MLKAFIVVALWGSSYVVTKGVTMQMSASALGFIRWGIAALSLLAVAPFAGCRILPPWRELPIVALVGVLGVGVSGVLWHAGVQLTLTSHSSLIMTFSPIIAALLSWALSQESFPARKTLGILISFLGVGAVISESLSFELEREFLVGDLFMLGAAVSWASYVVYCKSLISTLNPFALSLLSFLFGTFFLVPFAYLEDLPAQTLSLSLKGWIGVLYLSIPLGAGSFFLWNSALKRVAVSTVMVISNLLPLIAAFLAWLFLGEGLSLYFGLGLALVASGIYLVTSAGGVGRR
ncbi:MAG: DMT family transporter [Nitrospinota bacterium]